MRKLRPQDREAVVGVRRPREVFIHVSDGVLPSEKPRIPAPPWALRRVDPVHVVMAEVIRALSRFKYRTACPVVGRALIELTRRGCLNPQFDLVYYGETVVVNRQSAGGKRLIKAVAFLREMGMVSPRGHSAAREYVVTELGLQVLAHWDDPDSEGVFLPEQPDADPDTVAEATIILEVSRLMRESGLQPVRIKVGTPPPDPDQSSDPDDRGGSGAGGSDAGG